MARRAEQLNNNDDNGLILHNLDGLQETIQLNIEADAELINNAPAFLPIRIACAAHTLNLVGKTDSFNALVDFEYSELYFDVMKKLNAIWNASTSSRKNCELVERILKRRILKPHRIRWNRIYDAVSF